MNYDEKELAEEFLNMYLSPMHRDDVLLERDVVIQLIIEFKRLKVEL